MSFQEISEQFGLKEKGGFFKVPPKLRSRIRATGIKPDEVENMVELFFELPRSAHSDSVLYSMLADAYCGKYENVRLRSKL